MRIIDYETGEEIEAPDLERGELVEVQWVDPARYASIDNVTKFALDDADYEAVLMYYRREDVREPVSLAQRVEELEEALIELAGIMAEWEV